MAQNQKNRVNSYTVCHGDSAIDTDIHITIIIRPHCSTTYVDVAYCYRPSSVVCLSVGL